MGICTRLFEGKVRSRVLSLHEMLFLSKFNVIRLKWNLKDKTVNLGETQV